MADLNDTIRGASEPAHAPETARARNARVGLIFFTIYLVLYCGYVGLTAFARSVMAMTPIAGLNVATLYGLGLIVTALIFAVGYGWACRLPSSAGNIAQWDDRSVEDSAAPASGNDA
jgi:uncharacterized membrane protein (DUF485 family)